MKRLGLTFRMRACPRCNGDAYRESAEDQDWRCLQCGRSVPQEAINAIKVTTQGAASAA